MTIRAQSEHCFSRGSAYQRYKTTTKAFRDGLDKLVPFELESISDLAKAANHVATRQKRARSLERSNNTINAKEYDSLLEYLEETIQLREKVGATYAEDFNDGHHYIIQILKYCHQTLRTFRSQLNKDDIFNGNATLVTDKKNSINAADIDQQQHNQFHELSYCSSSDDEDDVENDQNASEVVPNVEPLSTSKEYSINDDLIEGSVVFQIHLLFLNAENLFTVIDDAFGNLKQQLDSKPSNHQAVVYLLQASAAVSLALKDMKYLEESLMIEFEDAFSIYHIFAVLIFQQQIYEMEDILGPQILQQISKHQKKLSTSTCCYSFVAHCVKLGLMGMNNYKNGSFDTVARSFFYPQKRRRDKKCKPSAAQFEKLKAIGLRVCVTADMECIIPPHILATMSDKGIDAVHIGDGVIISNVSNSWLKNYSLLGGKSGIMSTIFSLKRSKNKLSDELHLSKQCIVYFLCGMRKRLHNFDRYAGKTLFAKLMPLFYYVHNSFPIEVDFTNGSIRCKDLDFTTVFALHTVYHGMQLLQGHRKRIAVLSRLTQHQFDAQLKEFTLSSFCKRLKEKPPLLNLASTLSKHEVGDIELFWNPIFAGNFLSFTTISTNVYFGFDCAAETRVVVHLYNALRQRKMIPNLDLLEILDRIYSRYDQFWPGGGKPVTKGFLKSYFMVLGYTNKLVDLYINSMQRKEMDKTTTCASNMAKKCLLLPSKIPLFPDCAKKRLQLLAGNLPQDKKLLFEHFVQWITLRNINFDLSQPVGRILPSVLDCFTGMDDFEKKQVSAVGESLCSEKAAFFKEKISEEHELLCVNWLLVAQKMDEFLNLLFHELGITNLLEIYIQCFCEHQDLYNTYNRNLGYNFLAVMVLHELEFSGDDFQHGNSKVAANLMLDYFTKNATLKSTTFF